MLDNAVYTPGDTGYGPTTPASSTNVIDGQVKTGSGIEGDLVFFDPINSEKDRFRLGFEEDSLRGIPVAYPITLWEFAV